MKGETGGRGPSDTSRVFTDYVRAPDPKDREVAPLLVALRAALRSEIKRRGLWETLPSYLGIYGSERWDAGEGGRSGVGGGPLDELLADCFGYIFVDRLRALAAQLLVKDNIEGLVYLNVRHFVYERQRDCDPLGTRVFEVLHRAVRAAIDAGELAILAGDPKIRNDTLLTWNAGQDALPSEERAGRLHARVARWCDDLLPDLITATGRHEDPIVVRLRERLTELWDDGFEVIQFRELVDPLKAEVRARWATLLGTATGRLGPSRSERGVPSAGAGEPTGAVDRFEAADPEPGPDLAFEQRDRYRALVACVLGALARLPADERTRRILGRLWGYLRVWAAEGGVAGDRLPPDREISRQLKIPRERIPAALATIRDLIAGCRSPQARAESSPTAGRRSDSN